MAAASAAPDRITRPIDPARTTVLRGQVHRLAQARYDQGAADPNLQIPYVTVFLQPGPGLEPFLATQHGKWLTPEQFADRFGVSQNDTRKITAWLASQGLHVNDVARGRHWITFSGSAGVIGRALHTEIHRYQVGGQMHFANATDPAIPAALQGVVAGFTGLDDFQPTPVRQPQPAYNAPGGEHWLAPGDLATIYDVTPLYKAGIDGTGQTIVVVGDSDPLLDDVSQYRQMFGLPPNNPETVLAGADPGITVGLLEADLDLEVAGALAPQASLVYVYSSSFFTALQYAVDQSLGQILSVSFGVCEATAPLYQRAVLQQANAQGITVVVASGDAGAATCDRFNPTPQASSGVSVSWPASLPEVTAVGGTEFNEGTGNYWLPRAAANGGSAKSYIPETTWNDSAALNGLDASGGGPSALFPKPAWQSGNGVPNDNVRDVPDISFAASDRHDPYAAVLFGFPTPLGGTSASAPLFAGMLALLNQYEVSQGVIAAPGLGNINPSLYTLAQTSSGAFHDITTGSSDVPCAQGTLDCVNGVLGFNAGPGYDLTTGLGSLDLNNFITQWKPGLPATVSLSLSPTAAGLTDTVQLTATVAGAGATPTGSVAFLALIGNSNAVSLGSVNLVPGSMAGTATAVFSATGAQLAVGGGNLQAVYSGDPVYAGSQANAPFTVIPPSASGSVVIPFITPNPVPEGNGVWPYYVGLTEVAGVPTTLTSFTIDGERQSLSYWSSTSLPANGTIYTQLYGSQLTAPLVRHFVFNGRDLGGPAWTQQLAVSFQGPSGGPVPAISLTTSTPTIPQDTTAAENCQWTEQVTLQETGGFETLLTGMTANLTNLASRIQTTFGTTRLAPYGFLEGTLCVQAFGPVDLSVTGLSDSGSYPAQVFSTVHSTLQAAMPSAPVQFTSPTAGGSYTFTAEDASSTPAAQTIPVSFTSGSPAWTVSVGPVNPTTSWLTLSATSGTGAGSITVAASPTGLSPGAYTAILTFASASAQPLSVTVPVTLVVGASSNISIAGLANNLSAGLIAAPGMIAAVYGSQMAPSGTSLTAPGLPLPLSLGGVSATVNGVTAPLYFVSPGQIDLQIPYETSAGTAVLAVNNNGQIATFPFTVAPAAPGLFPSAVSNATGALVTSASVGDVVLLFMTGDGDVSPTLATGATPSEFGIPSNDPKPRLPVTVTIGGVAAKVLFQAIPAGLAGETQINLQIGADIPTGPQQVVVTVGGVAAPAVNLTVNAQ